MDNLCSQCEFGTLSGYCTIKNKRQIENKLNISICMLGGIFGSKEEEEYYNYLKNNNKLNKLIDSLDEQK